MDYLVNLKKKKIIILGLCLIIVVGAGGILGGYFHFQHKALAENRAALTVTGTIEAKTIVASFKVPGRIESISVQEGDAVTKGEELAVLDKRELEAKLRQAQGAREAAEGQVSQAGIAISLTGQQIEAKVEQAKAVLSKAQVGVTNAEQQLERVHKLQEGGAASQSMADQAQNAYDAAVQDLEAARGQLNESITARLQVQVAESQYKAATGLYQQADGSLAEAEAYVDNAVLKAPYSGYITDQFLEEGEMLNAGTPVFEITDLEHTFVKVFIDETKIGRVQIGQEAQISLDAYPGQVFKGKVVWINDAGQFAVKKAISEQYSHDIRSFEVKIEIPNEKLQLKTGMTATVKIIEGEK